MRHYKSSLIFQQMLQQNAVEHGAFHQRKCADGGAVIQRGTDNRQILRNAFSACVLMQLSIAGSSTLSASVISPAITIFAD